MKLNKKNMEKENRVQVEAFRRLKGNELELIRDYAADFRDIITEFESMHQGQDPFSR